MNELATVIITTPKGDKQKSLKYHALDSHSRDLATQTRITVGDKMLPCMSYRVLDNGNLQLEILADCFEIQTPTTTVAESESQDSAEQASG